MPPSSSLMKTLPLAFMLNCLVVPLASAESPSANPPNEATPTFVSEAYSLENVRVFAASLYVIS